MKRPGPSPPAVEQVARQRDRVRRVLVVRPPRHRHQLPRRVVHLDAVVQLQVSALLDGGVARARREDGGLQRGRGHADHHHLGREWELALHSGVVVVEVVAVVVVVVEEEEEEEQWM